MPASEFGLLTGGGFTSVCSLHSAGKRKRGCWSEGGFQSFRVREVSELREKASCLFHSFVMFFILFFSEKARLAVARTLA